MELLPYEERQKIKPGVRATFLPVDELEAKIDEWLKAVNVTLQDVIIGYKKAIMPLAGKTFTVMSFTDDSYYSHVKLKEVDDTYEIFSRRILPEYFHFDFKEEIVDENIPDMFGNAIYS